MSETIKQIDNIEIQEISEKLEQLDKDFDSKSSQLSKKLVNIEETIENLQKDDKINQKYSNVIQELQHRLEDLREDWTIDNKKDLTDLVHNNLDYINIPKWHIVSYEWKINWERFIISEPEKNWSYYDFKLFIENGWKQNEINVNKVTRYRDGWTTYVKTDIWTFYFPTSFSNQKATFTDLKWDITNIETGEEIDILWTLEKISWNDLFEKNKEAYTLMCENFYNESTMTDKALSLFKNKINEYAINNWYTLEEWFKVWYNNWIFFIEKNFIKSSPKWTPENAGRLELFFWD